MAQTLECQVSRWLVNNKTDWRLSTGWCKETCVKGTFGFGMAHSPRHFIFLHLFLKCCSLCDLWNPSYTFLSDFMVFLSTACTFSKQSEQSRVPLIRALKCASCACFDTAVFSSVQCLENIHSNTFIAHNYI